MDRNSTLNLAVGHLMALVGAVVLFGVTFYLLLANIDPYASHTTRESARVGSLYVMLLYSAFAVGIHRLKRKLASSGVAASTSLYVWTALILPPVAFVALMGLGSTY